MGRYQALISEGVRILMLTRPYSTPILVTDDSASGTLPLERMHFGDKAKKEKWLQERIHHYPACLPLDQIEPAFGDLIPVCMELSTPHGAIDNLFMTPSGDLLLIEVKLWQNSEARRKVVAQALDYVAWLFSVDYEELERTILKNKSVAESGANSLYELVYHPEQLDEAAFIDSVNHNLSKGRALVLVVGDGIRTEAQKLVELLEDYGNLQFTFALIELAVFGRNDRPEEFLICPRVLAKTEMLRRTIFDIQLGAAPLATRTGATGTRTQAATAEKNTPLLSISSEQFWESMTELDASLPDKLQSFLGTIEELGVTPEFKRSLILRWTTPEGQPINLGYIERNGKIWTTDIHNKLPRSLTDAYIRDLAEALNQSIAILPSSGKPYVSREGGGGVAITDVVDSLSGWKDCISVLIEAVRSNPDSL
ncbi:MAG: hypothetical protein RLN89_06350 [Parvibaculum sp.]